MVFVVGRVVVVVTVRVVVRARGSVAITQVPVLVDAESMFSLRQTGDHAHDFDAVNLLQGFGFHSIHGRLKCSG